jgi:hypothetical protein
LCFLVVRARIIFARGESHCAFVSHICVRSQFPIYAHVSALADKLMDSDRYMASGRSRGSLHICAYGRSLHIYWFNLGQGKTALSDTCTLTPTEYISACVCVMHRVYVLDHQTKCVSKAARVPAICSATVYFITLHMHKHSLSATVLCPAGYRFSTLQCIAGHNETRSCDAVCGGVQATRSIADCRLNLYLEPLGIMIFQTGVDKARVICIS